MIESFKALILAFLSYQERLFIYLSILIIGMTQEQFARYSFLLDRYCAQGEAICSQQQFQVAEILM